MSVGVLKHVLRLVSSRAVRPRNSKHKKKYNGKEYIYDNWFIDLRLYVPKSVSATVYVVDRYKDSRGRPVFVIRPEDLELKLA